MSDEDKSEDANLVFKKGGKSKVNLVFTINVTTLVAIGKVPPVYVLSSKKVEDVF